MLNLSNIILLICVSCMFSCKTVLLSDLKPENPIINLLPSLEPKVDIASLQSAYSLGSTKSRGSIVGYGTQSLGGIISTGSFYGQSTSFADKRIQDAVVLFEREIRNNISDGSNEPIGSVVCKIISGETRKSGLGWSALSLVTFFTYNIFGELGSDSGKKSMFSRVIFSRQKYYDNRARIRIKNKSTIIITYTYETYTITQTLFIENFKIN